MQNYRLFNGLPCGTNTRKIYEEFAEKFGWDKFQANQFGRQGAPLYARKATPEGYNVWCIGHSNWTEDKGGDWSNEISYGEEFIDEYWEDISHDYNDFISLRYRVTFAKKKGSGYHFLGVYEVCENPDTSKKVLHNDKSVWVKHYHRICENYPINT